MILSSSLNGVDASFLYDFVKFFKPMCAIWFSPVFPASKTANVLSEMSVPAHIFPCLRASDLKTKARVAFTSSKDADEQRTTSIWRYN